MSKQHHRRATIPAPAPRPQVVHTAVLTAPEDGSPLVDLEEDAYDPNKVERIHIFTLGGVKYTVPSEVPASLAVEMLARTAEDGAEETMWWTFNEVLGEDAVEALRSYKGLTMKHLGAVFAICQQIITGSSADPKSPRRGSGLPR